MERFFINEPLTFDLIEEISDYELLQQLFEHLPMEEEKKVQFLSWYLWHYYQFFKDNRNINLYLLVPTYVQAAHGQQCVDLTKDYSADFYQKQRECFLLSHVNPSREEYEQQKEVLAKWGIRPQFVSSLVGVVPMESKKYEVSIKKNRADITKKLSVSSTKEKKGHEILEKYLNHFQLKHYLREEELMEVKGALFRIYDKKNATKIYQKLIMQNKAILEREFLVIRMSLFEEEENVIYEKALQALFYDGEFLNPNYEQMVRWSILEIHEMLKVLMDLDSAHSDMVVYQEMAKEEIRKIEEMLPYLYINGSQSRYRKS